LNSFHGVGSHSVWTLWGLGTRRGDEVESWSVLNFLEGLGNHDHHLW
jgi:hypothetical protein